MTGYKRHAIYDRLRIRSPRASLHVVEQRHQTEIHMQLLVAMEQRQPRVVRNEIYFRFLVSSEHQHIFHDSGGGFSGQARKFKTVPVQMDWVNVIACVAQTDAI